MIRPRHVGALLCGILAADMVLANAIDGWTHEFIGYNDPTPGTTFKESTFYFDDPMRQFLHIREYKDQRGGPVPVYVFAHGNGKAASAISKYFNVFEEAGVTIVSWESITACKNPDDWVQCSDDSALAFNWVVNNADTYNFDATKIIMGGESRGSVCSYRHSLTPNVGIIGYMAIEALPGAFENPDDLADWNERWETSFNDGGLVPVYVTYKMECAKPILGEEETCIVNPNPTDTHTPHWGMFVKRKYEEFGIGEKCMLIDGLTNYGLDRWAFFSDFVQQVTTNPALTSLEVAPLRVKENYGGPTCFALWQLCATHIWDDQKSNGKWYADPGACIECATPHAKDLVASGCTKPGVASDCNYPLPASDAIDADPYADFWNALAAGSEADDAVVIADPVVSDPDVSDPSGDNTTPNTTNPNTSGATANRPENYCWMLMPTLVVASGLLR